MTVEDGGHERALTTAAIRGDVDAVRVLWQRHRRWVAAILLAHKPGECELDDLLQDVAMTFVRTISRLRDDAMLKPWLRTVAINAARAAGRDATRRRRHPKLALTHDNAPASDAAGPPRQAGEHDEAARLLGLARTLPEGYREPLLLRCVRGMNYRQISELTGLPESTIETRIARGRRMLRELAIQTESGEPQGQAAREGGSGRMGTRTEP